MITTTSWNVLLDRARLYLSHKNAFRYFCNKRVRHAIVKEQQKNGNIYFAIVALDLLSDFVEDSKGLNTQLFIILKVIALKMSECTIEDLDFVTRILLRTRQPLIRSMCYVWRYSMGVTDDYEKEAILSQYQLLTHYRLGHYFCPRVPKHPSKMHHGTFMCVNTRA